MFKEFLFSAFGYIGYIALIVILLYAIVTAIDFTVRKGIIAKDFCSYLWAKGEFLRWRDKQRKIAKETSEQKEFRLILEKVKIERELARMQEIKMENRRIVISEPKKKVRCQK